MTSVQQGKFVPVVEKLSGMKVVNKGIPGGCLTPDGYGRGNVKTAVLDPNDGKAQADLITLEVLPNEGAKVGNIYDTDDESFCGWTAEKWVQSLKTIKSHKGAAFVAGAMEECQNLGLDMLMYYDARPHAMNGMFKTDMVCDVLKGYYPFYMFNQLYRLKNAVEVNCLSENLYGCAAANGTESAIMFTLYHDQETNEEEIKLEIVNLDAAKGSNMEFYLLDEDHDCTLVKTESVHSDKYNGTLQLKMYSTVLVKIKNGV